MAADNDKKISELPEITSLSSTDLATVVRPGDPEGTKNKKITIENFLTNAALKTTEKDYVGGINENFDKVETTNGSILETISLSISSSGSVITASLSAAVGTDLNFVFSSGIQTVDVTTPKTVSLTAGTDTVPQENWLYVLESDPTTLVASSSGFPDETTTEYAKIGRVIVQSATTVQADGVLKQHNYTDHIKTNGNVGHISDINEWIREQWATWISGVSPTITGSGTATVTYATTSGIVRQLHKQAFPAITDPADVYVINDNTTPYRITTNIGGGILSDSVGGSLTNKYYNLVIWGVSSKSGSGESKLFINLPSGSYSTQAQAEADASRLTDYGISSQYKGTGFLIQRILMRNQTDSTFTTIETEDLRGQFPQTIAGTSIATATKFPDNTFRVFNNADNTKEIEFDASGVPTGTTKTISISDDLTVSGASDIDQDVTTTATVTHAGATLTGLSDGIVKSSTGLLSGGNSVTLTSEVTGVLPVANGGTNSSAALGNDKVMISSGGAIIESAAITTSELGLLDGIVSVTTGTSDNDKFVTEGYVNDHIGTALKQEVLTISGDGQTAFTLSSTPTQPTRAQLYLNGQVSIYTTDFTISGTSLTWNDPGGLTLKTTDDFQIWYW